MEGLVKKAARLLSGADAIFVTSGAGMGVDSNLSTFRGRNAPEEGWGKKRYAPYHMSKVRTFDEEPHLAWGYHLTRMEAYVRANPHVGYYYVKDMMNSAPMGGACFTSNIDSHWERTLGEEAVIVECHGSMEWMQCNENCVNQVWMPREGDVDGDVNEDGTTDHVPKCINPDCSEYARFNVCLIGDVCFCTRRLDEERERYEIFIKSILNGPPKKVVVLEVGAGTGIPTVRRESARLCKRFGAPLIRINMDDPELDTPVDVDYLDASNPDHVSIGGVSALEVLTQIYSEWAKMKNE
jgi:NAD-dependent SIR2 family protein deacetylase